MKRLILIGGALAALVAPAVAGAETTKTDKTNAAKECRSERGTTAATREAFRVRYGTNRNGRNAFGKCVSSRAKAERTERREAVKRASKRCKSERTELGPQTFADKYGSGKKGANALGKCVSTQARADKRDADRADAKRIKARKRAARTCATERKADREAFREQYGTNTNGRNAFGKCVSATANAKGS